MKIKRYRCYRRAHEREHPDQGKRWRRCRCLLKAKSSRLEAEVT